MTKSSTSMLTLAAGLAAGLAYAGAASAADKEIIIGDQ